MKEDNPKERKEIADVLLRIKHNVADIPVYPRAGRICTAGID